MTAKVYGVADIGGTKTRTGLVTEFGEVLSSSCFQTITGEHGADRSVEKMLSLFSEQCEKIGIDRSELSGVGVVCAGPVDPAKGTIENPYTLPGWDGYPITEKIQKRLGCICKLENDANGMLLGEVEMKKLAEKRVLMLTFGTGIGVAIFINNEIYRSNGRFHAEMGHVIVDSYGPQCYCRHPGCFESWCSGSALNRQAQENGYRNFDELFDKWKQNKDEKAQLLMDGIKRRICNGVFNLMAIFKPDEVILGGGLVQGYFEFLKDTIIKDLDGLSDFVEPFVISKAAGGGESALVGAAMLFK